jgi:hypothetical protein
MLFNFEKINRKETRIFLWLSLAFVVFYTIRLFSGIYKLADSDEYFYTADLIANGNYFQRSTAFYDAFLKTRRPFFYPLFLDVFRFAKIEFILFVQTLFGIFNIWLMIQLHKKLNARLSWVFIILVIFTPSIFIYTQLIMTEWLVMTLLLLLSILLVSPWNKKRFLLIQVTLVLLVFTKPVFYLFVFVNLLYFSIYLYRIRTFTVSLFIPVIFLTAYIGFNDYRTGYAHFSSIENTNLIDYNLYYFRSSQLSKADADKWIHNVYTESDQYTTFKTRSVFLKSQGKKVIANNFFTYSIYHFYTALRGIIDPGRFDLMTFFKKEDGRQGFLEILNSGMPLKKIMNNRYAFIYILLAPIFLVQLIKIPFILKYIYGRRKKVNFLNFYLLLLIVYYILVTGPVDCSRLMMPLQGILIVVASAGIGNLIRKRHEIH